MSPNSAQTVGIAHDLECESVTSGDAGFPDIGLSSHLSGLERTVMWISKEKRELFVNALLDAPWQSRIVAVK